MAQVEAAMTAKQEEEKWQAESDARTLAEAEVIRKDGPRLKKAQKAAKQMEKERKDEAEAMAKIANAKLDYSNSPKPPKK